MNDPIVEQDNRINERFRPLMPPKIINGPNTKCQCGSGKKQKKCHYNGFIK